jgi:hypothetical protein
MASRTALTASITEWNLRALNESKRTDPGLKIKNFLLALYASR